MDWFRLCDFYFDLVNNKELGNGNFGTVYSADYGDEAQEVVVKKMKGESPDTKHHFLKEAEILSGINHENIPSFLGFSDNLYGLMMEYAGMTSSIWHSKKQFAISKILKDLLMFCKWV